MPRLKNRLPSYRLHKASGNAAVTLDGKGHYLGRHGTKASQREFEQFLAEHLARA